MNINELINNKRYKLSFFGKLLVKSLFIASQKGNVRGLVKALNFFYGGTKDLPVSKDDALPADREKELADMIARARAMP